MSNLERHTHTRGCWDDPGPGHGPPSLVCGLAEGEPVPGPDEFRLAAREAGLGECGTYYDSEITGGEDVPSVAAPSWPEAYDAFHRRGVRVRWYRADDGYVFFFDNGKGWDGL